MFWSSLLKGSEVLDLFLIVLDIAQLLTAFSAPFPAQYGGSMQVQTSGHTSEVRWLLWLQRLRSWSRDSHPSKSLRNKMRRKENTSLGCWWFLEENLICNLWFGLQLFVCVDFTAVEMRHLVTSAGAGPALGRCSTRSLTSPQSKHRLCSKILWTVLQAKIFGQQNSLSILRAEIRW